jgi:hypothetical protein
MTIRTDATRLKLRPTDLRRPRAVAPRQGQVLTDTDLEQQATLTLTRIDSGTSDMLGRPDRLVVPSGGPAFLITAAPVLANCGIGKGIGYLDGWQVENRTENCTLATQPHPRTDSLPAAPLVIGLKALVRHVDPVEENAWADKGLGDAQASGRTLLDWQVFPFLPGTAAPAPISCATAAAHPDWLKLTAPSTGTLVVIPDATAPASDPCSLTPQGGFRRGENLLYRIEVHGGVRRADFPSTDGARYGLNGLRIKLSRGNAAVLARIDDTNGVDITVSPPALDPLNWFAPGLYAEIVSIHDDVLPPDPSTAATERLFRVARATDKVIRLEAGAATLAAAIKGQPGWFLRLWDGFSGLTAPGTVTVDTTGHPDQSQDIDLGDGLKVRLGGGATAAVFRRGDFWTWAARADGTVDWPTGLAEVPHGPAIRYAPLAVLKAPATAPVAEDCRIPAATLTDRTLLYRGGDGQEIAQPIPVTAGFAALPAPLRVAVMRGRLPVAGATVRWSVPAGSPASRINGQPVGGATVLDLPAIGPDGLCQVTWAIDQTQPDALHRVQAEILSPAGAPEPHALVFNAGFRTAVRTSYLPGACTLLNTATTVQEALDTLCTNIGGSKDPETLRLTSIRLFGRATGDTELLQDEHILNGIELPHDVFDQAIVFGVSGNGLQMKPEPFDPIVEVELDLPYPITDPDRRYWLQATSTVGTRDPRVIGPFGFQRVRLDGTVDLSDRTNPGSPAGLVWQPSKQAQGFIETLPLHRGGQRIVDRDLAGVWNGGPDFERILCRLRVRSAHVWAVGSDGRSRVYLNAEHLGAADGLTNRELLVRERDPQRAADLEMFFYLRLG